MSSTNAFRRRKDQAIRLRGVCRKVGDLKFNDRREYKFGSTLCGAQENLSRDLSVSLQKVWARELRRRCEKECGGGTEGKRFFGSLGVKSLLQD